MHIKFFFVLMLCANIALSQEGFFNFEWNEEKGQLLLEVKDLGEEFLYVNSLAAGVGSNDIGLDRGQLGNDRIVKFEKVGNKILLIQPNYRFRAVSENQAEVKSMEEAFAKSVIGGFKIIKSENGIYTIDLAPFLMRDAHGVADRLESTKQGNYKIDPSKSAVYLPNTLSFPDNTEFEAMITFVGKPKGREIRTVTPDAKMITVHMHHSFVRLPDENYTPREYHPYSGYFNVSYYDYAVPIYESTSQKFIVRHRLEKKDPNAEISDPVEPIIYYIDPGCPEPVKSALMDGAAWWNQAFTAAGYRNAFQIKELPAGANPLDVRYNMIQWVHRSTRGWSYGASVTDPRTGEIIKGHVSLGSLRVRQDFMIAQGILSPYGADNENHGPAMEMALARLRQLSAHEIGHTLGLAHNFAASQNDRASVMDYPHPFIKVNSGVVDFSQAYDDKIGDWDKRTILYGYQDFPEDVNESEMLSNIIKETQEAGYLFQSDPDSRPIGGLNPNGHLWDNGEDPISELQRMNEVRNHALEKFGKNTIPTGIPYSELEKILVPVYLMHRYQAEAVAKLIGGVQYNYATKGDALNPATSPVIQEVQNNALNALLYTVSPEYLKVPNRILSIIPPSAYGYSTSRESFSGNTGLAFDPYAAAEASINHIFTLLFNTQRLARLNQQGENKLSEYLLKIGDEIFAQSGESDAGLKMLAQKLLIIHMINATKNSKDHQVAALTKHMANKLLINYAEAVDYENDNQAAHFLYLSNMLETYDKQPDKWKLPSIKALPPGSPIGCE